MSTFKMKILAVLFIVGAVGIVHVSGAFGGSDRIRLEDVKVLTLYNGKMTNGRRSAPVPQLKCVGGSAAGAFVPQVVQCMNQGSDGFDVQWECKTDMDNRYRFGPIQVVCEGYDYPDDPYILKGSCGLEYTLELTEEGRQKRHGHHSNYHHDSNYDHNYHQGSQHYHGYGKKVSSVFSDLIYLALIAGLIYVIYKKCIATQVYSDDAPPPYDGQQRRDFPSSQPPPYGFRQDYMPNNDSCSSGQTYSGAGYSGSQTHTPGTGTGGGFWTGAATGGLMGYLFGSRTNTHHRHRPHGGWGWGTGWGSGWGTGNSWDSGWTGGHTTTTYSSGGGSSSSSGSSGTRTASGFGGTSRR